MKRLLLLIAGALIYSAAAAQQDPQFSMNMFNKQVLNPAYAGAPGVMQLTGVGRTQWVGIDGHPNTFTASFNAPVPILRGGLGIVVMNDQIGPFSTTTLKGAYAFRLPLGPGALQLGISPGLFFKNLDAGSFRYEDQGDPFLNNLGAGKNLTGFDLGAGVYYMVPSGNPRDDLERFYVGFAADHLLEPKLKAFSSESGDGTVLNRAFGLMAGYRIGGNRAGAVSFVPSAYFKMAAAQMQLDLNANLHVRPMVFGVSYRGLRNVSELVGIMGFHATQRLFVAYSYDYTISGLGQSTSGSHEILVTYTFPSVTRYYPPELDTRQKPDIR